MLPCQLSMPNLDVTNLSRVFLVIFHRLARISKVCFSNFFITFQFTISQFLFFFYRVNTISFSLFYTFPLSSSMLFLCFDLFHSHFPMLFLFFFSLPILPPDIYAGDFQGAARRRRPSVCTRDQSSLFFSLQSLFFYTILTFFTLSISQIFILFLAFFHDSIFFDIISRFSKSILSSAFKTISPLLCLFLSNSRLFPGLFSEISKSLIAMLFRMVFYDSILSLHLFALVFFISKIFFLHRFSREYFRLFMIFPDRKALFSNGNKTWNCASSCEEKYLIFL